MRGEWNLYKEISPEKESEYLVLTKKGAIKLDRYEINKGWVNLDKYLRGQYGTEGTYIYAWMEIPEPPYSETQREFKTLSEKKVEINKRLQELKEGLGEV